MTKPYLCYTHSPGLEVSPIQTDLNCSHQNQRRNMNTDTKKPSHIPVISMRYRLDWSTLRVISLCASLQPQITYRMHHDNNVVQDGNFLAGIAPSGI